MRWDIESLHYVERRLLNASSLQSELRTLGIHVADVAMVDAQGCVYTHPPFGVLMLSILKVGEKLFCCSPTQLIYG